MFYTTYIIDLRTDKNDDYFKKSTIEKNEIKKFQFCKNCLKKKIFFDEEMIFHTKIQYNGFKINKNILLYLLVQLRPQFKRQKKATNHIIYLKMIISFSH